jgi:hypothetical protein
VQSSLAPRANQKLSFKYFGPFQVLQRIGTVSYKLDLSASSLVHHVFHVSQLKKVVGSHTPVSTQLLSEASQFEVPEKVLQHHIVSKGVKHVHQALIRWLSSPASLATWEDLIALKQRFLDAPAWGQVGTVGGGNVSDRAVVMVGTKEKDSMEVGLVRKRERKPNPAMFGQEWHV